MENYEYINSLDITPAQQDITVLPGGDGTWVQGPRKRTNFLPDKVISNTFYLISIYHIWRKIQ